MGDRFNAASAGLPAMTNRHTRNHRAAGTPLGAGYFFVRLNNGMDKNKSDTHIYLHIVSDSVETKLDTIIDQLHIIIEKDTAMSQSLDDLTAQVTANTEVEASAVALIKGLADKVAAAGTDPAALAALQQELHASADALGAAVTANTDPAPVDPNAP